MIQLQLYFLISSDHRYKNKNCVSNSTDENSFEALSVDCSTIYTFACALNCTSL